MHIIAGEFRHRKLSTPKGDDVRPTSAVVREAIFNICQNIIEGASFLDLCAGSGAMGFEALSRGAEKVTFVENLRESLKCIKENQEKLGVEERTEIRSGNVLTMISRMAKEGISYDIIYIDPPYYEIVEVHGEKISYAQRILQLVDEAKLLKSDGILFVEEGDKSKGDISSSLKNLALVKSRNFGKAKISQYQRLS